MHAALLSLFWLLVFGLASQAGQAAGARDGPDALTMPVPGGTAAILRAARVEATVEPARALLVLARALHGRVPLAGRGIDRAALEAYLANPAGGEGAGDDDDVPALLPREVWEQAVFNRVVQPSRLAFEILRDRRAALLYCGLFSLDSATLAYFASHPALVALIHSNAAGPFAAVAESITVRGGSVVLPGGPGRVREWERLVGRSAAEPGQFIPVLLERDAGRLAWLFDALASLDAARQTFALRGGLELLYARFSNDSLPVDFVWRPFTRPPVDLGFALRAVTVTGDGALAPPADLALWEQVFMGRARGEAGPQVTAPWLLRVLAALPSRERRTRLETLAFAQRVFAGFQVAGSGDGAEALPLVLSAYGSHSALLLTVERLGFTNPADHAAAIRAVALLTAETDRLRASLRLAMFQGALALVVRLSDVGTIDRPTARRLAASLFGLPGRDMAGFADRIESWLEGALLAALPGAASDDPEQRLLGGLAGVAVPRPAPVIIWEDYSYRVDVGAGELARLRRIRQRQGGNDLTALLEVRRAVSRGENVTPHLARLVSNAHPPGDRGLFQSAAAGSADSARPPEAAMAGKAGSRAGPAAPAGRLADWREIVLGQLLASYAYAIAIGDPDSSLLLAGNPADAHDFGLGAAGRQASWLVAASVRAGSQLVERGSLLGLGLALAVPSMRQATLAAPAVAPNLGQDELQGLAEGIAMLNPFRMDDGDRDALAEDLRRGRERIRAAARSPDALDAVAADAGVERWRRRLMRLQAPADTARVLSYWSLDEVRRAGRTGPTPASHHAWGPGQRRLDGSWRTALPSRLAMHELGGRPGDGLASAQIADLHLRVAEWLSDARLPAALAPGILRSAAWDLAMNTRLADRDDWLAVVRAAQSVSSERMADYVSALTADGPLVPVPKWK